MPPRVGLRGSSGIPSACGREDGPAPPSPSWPAFFLQTKICSPQTCVRPSCQSAILLTTSSVATTPAHFPHTHGYTAFGRCQILRHVRGPERPASGGIHQCSLLCGGGTCSSHRRVAGGQGQPQEPALCGGHIWTGTQSLHHLRECGRRVLTMYSVGSYGPRGSLDASLHAC